MKLETFDVDLAPFENRCEHYPGDTYCYADEAKAIIKDLEEALRIERHYHEEAKVKIRDYEYPLRTSSKVVVPQEAWDSLQERLAKLEAKSGAFSDDVDGLRGAYKVPKGTKQVAWLRINGSQRALKSTLEQK